ncbi:MAG TPA: TetR/AcrR family transcriptional regulator [Micromonosporaceae bacterium]
MEVEPTQEPRGRQARKEQTRRALLAAARRVIEQRGLANLTTREVAQEAGVAVGTFFVHFPNVDVLVETLLDERIAGPLDEALRTVPTSGDLVTRLVHVARVLYASFDAEPELARQYLAASLFNTDPQGPTDRRLAEFQHWVTRQIDLAVAAGAVAPIDPTVAFTGYFSLYFGILLAGLRGQFSRAEQLALLETLLRRMFKTEKQL